MAKRTDKAKPAKKTWLGWVSGVVVVILVIAGGFLYVQHQQTQQAFAKDLTKARQLVLYNPLVKDGAAKKLQDELPGTGNKTTDAQLEKRLNHKDFKALIKKAEAQLAKTNKTELAKQQGLADKAEKKLDTLKKKSNFPADSKQSVTDLTKLSNTYVKQNDAIGLNVSVAELQSLAGQTATLIQKKTAKANALVEAAQNGTYPSIGALRGDLPNGGGVILIDEISNGPAQNAGLETVDDGGWDDSNAIVAINNIPVKSSVIGNDSMDNALKQIPLNSTATVKMKDGSTHKVKLNLSHNDASVSNLQDFLDPSGDDDTDIDFGVSGYNIGQHNNNKEIGLVITDIEAGSSADDSDLEVGDVICRIDNETVGDEDSIDRITSDYSDGDSVTVDYVTKSGHLKTTDITLSEY